MWKKDKKPDRNWASATTYDALALSNVLLASMSLWKCKVPRKLGVEIGSLHCTLIRFDYSIVKDSSADLGVNIKIVQNS